MLNAQAVHAKGPRCENKKKGAIPLTKMMYTHPK